MAFVVKDRVKETTTTTGTSDLVLSGSVSGFQSFSNALADGDTTYYALFEVSTNEWEVGVGTWTESTTTLARTTVLASSNSGSKVSLTAQAEVFITQPAGKAAFFDPSGDLTLVQDPTSNLQAATKQYVDTIAAAGLHYHDPVRVEQEGNLSATYSNGTAGVGATLTNNSTQAALTIDGVALSLNDRVLIYEQTNGYENGVYTVTNVGSASTNWVLTRATDADSYAPSDPDSLGQGDAFFVLEGTAGAGELYVMNTEGSITFGTTNITFTQVAATAVYSAGTGLTLTGTEFSADGANITNVDAVTLDGIDSSQFLRSDVADTKTAGDLSFADNVKATFGAGSDLQIYHDGSHSYVSDSGTGALHLRSTGGGVKVVDSTNAVKFTVAVGTGDVSVTGTVDGRDIAADGTKLDGIESGATADQTKADIDALNIDADTVDGIHASSFLRSDANDTTTGTLTIDSTTQTSFNVEYSNDGAGIGPILRTFRDSASPAVADALGGIDFKGNNSAGSEKFYARIKGVIVDPADTTEDGAVEISVAKAGTAAWEGSGLVAKFDPNGMILRGDLVFEGSTVDNSETTLTVTDPTADRTITLPDASGTVWTSGNDGSGSGLDADTVDGIQASSFLRSDASDTYTGTLTLGTAASNIYGSDSKPLVQLFNGTDAYFGSNSRTNTTLASSSSTGIRARINTTYYTMWHAGNDGSGSGLDADTLDGVQGSSFLRSDADDTTTGKLTISGSGTIGGSTISNGYLQITDGSAILAFDSNEIVGNANTYIRSVSGTALTLGTGTDPQITINSTGIRIGDQGNGYFRPVSGNYGSIEIDGGAHGGYEGYGIGGVAVFMTNSTQYAGLYNDANNHWWVRGIYNGQADIYYAGASKLQTTSTGVNVTGALTATTKSFVIDHPTKEGMKLRYGSLEGPEDGVYVRGRLTGETVIELPDYWTGLVHEDSITVQLTAMGGKADLWVESIADNKVTIGCDTEVDCFYLVQATRKDVDAWDVEYVADS